MNRVSLSESHERRINLPPLRRLLAYQKLRERIIYETCLAGVRLRSVGAGYTCISPCNSLEIETDYSQRAGTGRSLDGTTAAGEFLGAFLATCLCVFRYSCGYRPNAEDHMERFPSQLLNYAACSL